MTTSQWTPIRESSLLLLLQQAQQKMDDDGRRIWQQVRLEQPELWQQHPWGDEGCGFWVVAVFGRRCIYFNDIRGGFCLSSFRDWGNIDQYCQATPALADILNQHFLPEPA